MENKFSDGSSSGYVELPVEAAWMTWTRGDAKMAALKATDPALYYGGWRAFVKNKEGGNNPALPIPVVKRVSEDGKHEYEVYATNVAIFLPIAHRTRFELREKVKDPESGREYERVTSASKQRLAGYVPNRQVFGILFNGKNNEQGYCVLKVNKWSAFISFEKAGQLWNKITVPPGKALVRRYGSIGKNGSPVFETYGQSRSTPIEAVGIEKPVFIDVTPELEEIYEKAQEWRSCPMWNRDGEVKEPVDKTVVQAYLDACKAIPLSDAEIEQILVENDRDYAKALLALNPNQEEESPY